MKIQLGTSDSLEVLLIRCANSHTYPGASTNSPPSCVSFPGKASGIFVMAFWLSAIHKVGGCVVFDDDRVLRIMAMTNNVGMEYW